MIFLTCKLVTWVPSSEDNFRSKIVLMQKPCMDCKYSLPSSVQQYGLASNMSAPKDLKVESCFILYFQAACSLVMCESFKKSNIRG